MALLDRSLQAAAFLVVLSSNRFELIAERLPRELQIQLSGLKFRDFVVKPEAIKIAKELVNGLIEILTLHNLDIESVVRVLTNTSPKYFSDKDQSRLVGFQYLRLTSESSSPKDQMGLLERALDVTIDFEKKQEVKPLLYRAFSIQWRVFLS